MAVNHNHIHAYQFTSYFTRKEADIKFIFLTDSIITCTMYSQHKQSKHPKHARPRTGPNSMCMHAYNQQVK